MAPDPTPPPNSGSASTADAAAASAGTKAAKPSAKASAKAAKGWKKTKLRNDPAAEAEAGTGARDRGPGQRSDDLAQLAAPGSDSACASALAEVRLEPEGDCKGCGPRLGHDARHPPRARRDRTQSGRPRHAPKLATRLASSGPARGDWARIVSYSGDTSFADRAAALAHYDRAVGLTGLVQGLEAAKKSIATRLLSDRNVSIYEGGRNDIVQNKVDVRVLTVIAYLRETFGQVTVSSLISGHRLYARPGVISAHISGHALDIAGLGDTPIQGHQEPGGLTERAVREILFLPAEVMPRQVISLLGMGGPSFPMADHYNHIHIGF